MYLCSKLLLYFSLIVARLHFPCIPRKIHYTHFFRSMQGAALNAETNDLREKCLKAGQQLADEYRVLLQAVQTVTTKSGSDKTQLTIISRRIAQYVTELVAIAEQLKGIFLTSTIYYELQFFFSFQYVYYWHQSAN